MSQFRYSPNQIEPKWQNFWKENRTFKTLDPGDSGFDASKPKYYVLDMFPYPSGAGLHVGHPEGYTATDILARYKRAKGFNVLHPMGWDAFGLPAEQYAIQTGTHPAVTTQKNIATFKRQIESLGFSYDWDRELSTTDNKYVRWTQWIFSVLYDTYFDEATQKGRPISELPVPAHLEGAERELYVDKHRLAYLDEIPVWWCSKLGTVLANEEVIDGRSERGSHPCVRLPMRQWMLRITAYASRLLRDLELVEWPDETKKQQGEWIGESRGAEVWFVAKGVQAPADLKANERLRPAKDGGGLEFKIFTTRPDTLYGATFMVLSPEHALVDLLTTAERKAAVDQYRQQTAGKSDLERTAHKDKSGVFTGGYAVHPLTGADVPVWIADYVLNTYGSGAIMAVPAHDQRDFDFATTFGIPVVYVIAENGVVATEGCYCGPGVAVNSPLIDGKVGAEAIAAMIEVLEQKGLGQGKTTYRLRDWIFSRQRYWGEPFPVVHLEDGTKQLLPDSELPVTLPAMEDFGPSGRPEPPLGKATDWVEFTLPDGRKAHRETNTMPNWAGSCWYYLRFMDPDNDQAAWSKEKEQYWMPVDLYVGGREHAVLHLLYARFWHKVLFDRGYVTHPEPFGKLFHQGLILSFSYEDVATKVLVPSDMAIEKDGEYSHKEDGRPLRQVVAKMSKALKNVVNPDEIIQEQGADALRMYEMFIGPLEDSKPWNSRDVGGISRFLQRVWRLVINEETGENRLFSDKASEDKERALQRCIKKVGDDIERMAFNTAVSAMMIFLNEVGSDALTAEQLSRFVQVLAPFAPHLCEELWSRLGHQESLSYSSWPKYDPAFLEEATLEIPVQVNGKKRAMIQVPRDAENAVYEALARQALEGKLEGKEIKKIIVVPKRTLNVVVG
jgi:leucyl-tRNA synthetase